MQTDTRVVGSTKARAARRAQSASEDGSRPKVAAYGTGMPGGCNYGATAATGRGVVRVPGALVRSDGLISAERLEVLARTANTTGFALNVTQGYQLGSGYATPVRKDRYQVVGTKRVGDREVSGVTAGDLMEYVRDNIDLLATPNHMLVASRDRRTGVVTLDVCVVVRNYALARDMARVAKCAWFVNVQDGTKVTVRTAA